jgi:hypothetical protein
VNNVQKDKDSNKQKSFKSKQDNRNERGCSSGTREYQVTDCKYCGRSHNRDNCPSHGKKCHKCGKDNHFASMCKTKMDREKKKNRANKVEASNLSLNSDESSEDESSHWIGKKIRTVRRKVCNFVSSCLMPMVALWICGSWMKFGVDTGAEVNLMDEKSFKKLKQKPKLYASSVSLFGYNKTSIPLLGEFKTRIKSKGVYKSVKFRVTQGSFGNMLDYRTSVDLGILNKINNVKVGEEKVIDPLIKTWRDKLPNLFSGKVGQLKDHMVELHIDESVRPKQQKLRHVPFHQREAVETEIKKMLDQNLIEPVIGPTPWVSPIVIVPKSTPGEIRICTDARAANKAIKRERHVTPTVDDLTAKLNGAAVISKFDLRSGYNQLMIHPKCRYITAFCTHMGIFQYKRLNFGINTAAEIFQKTIEMVLVGLDGVINMSDDIFVFGKDQAEHDKNLKLVLERLEKSGLTLNEKKCELSKKELDFFGLHFSKDGISIQDSKLRALKDAKPPKTVSELRSILGLANYCSCFIPNLASLAKPLRALTKKGVKWDWRKEHDESLEAIKSNLTTESIAYFNKYWRTEITVDASPVGLGLVFAQYDPKNPSKRHIVRYDSRTLSDVESRYSQVEKEALAVVWACEKLHLYLVGCEFDIVTDNKAVELIFGNPDSKPKARIERWCLRLLPYSFVVKHRPGDGNIADYLSRNPINQDDNFNKMIHEEIAERYVRVVSRSCLPPSIRKRDIIRETDADVDLKEVKRMIRGEAYEKRTSLKAYERVKFELSCTNDGIIMRGNQVVIPKVLQKDVLKFAHSGHQGIDKTKRLLRTFVWFDGIDVAVEAMVKNCRKCQCNVKSPHLIPLRMTELPDGPWENLSIDYYGPLKNGKYLFVVVDEHSRYPIVKQVGSTSFKALKPILDDILATFGVPKEIKSDNGPPFNSSDFKSYSNASGFSHRRITPLWPKANGTCERFMKNLGKVMRNCEVDGSSFEVELLEFLRSYRATPHSSTGVSPNQLMFKTKSSTSRMPIIRDSESSSSEDDVSVRARIFDSKKKEKMKAYADRRNKAKESKIQVGDLVLILRDKFSCKSQTLYSKDEFEVVKLNGSQATVVRGNLKYKRNVSMLKRVGAANTSEKKNSQKTSFALHGDKGVANRAVTEVESVVNDLIDQVQNVRVTLDASQSSESSQDLHLGEILAGNETMLQAHDETQQDAQDEDADPVDGDVDTGFVQAETNEDESYTSAPEDEILIELSERRTSREKKPIDRYGTVVSSDQRKPHVKSGASCT